MPTALVTGAGRGIGAAITTRLAASGWTVFAGVRDEAGRTRLSGIQGDVVPIRLDITEDTHVAALPDQLPEQLDAVVNNAAIGVIGPLEAVTAADFRRQLEVNVVAQLAVTQAVLPLLRRARGRIIFISSSGGRAPVPLEGAYCASKFAIEGLADVLRVELRPWGIQVSLVEPGPTNTATWQSIQAMIDDSERSMSETHRTLYAPHITGLRKLVAGLAPRSMAPEVVAGVVERALAARHPRARYLVGAPAKSMVASRALLPTRLNDAIGARIGGWR